MSFPSCFIFVITIRLIQCFPNPIYSFRIDTQTLGNVRMTSNIACRFQISNGVKCVMVHFPHIRFPNDCQQNQIKNNAHARPFQVSLHLQSGWISTDGLSKCLVLGGTVIKPSMFVLGNDKNRRSEPAGVVQTADHDNVFLPRRNNYGLLSWTITHRLDMWVLKKYIWTLWKITLPKNRRIKMFNAAA